MQYIKFTVKRQSNFHMSFDKKYETLNWPNPIMVNNNNHQNT